MNISTWSMVAASPPLAPVSTYSQPGMAASLYQVSSTISPPPC